MQIKKYERYKMQIKAFIIKVNDSFSVFHFYNGNIWPGGPIKSMYYSCPTHRKSLLLALSIIKNFELNSIRIRAASDSFFSPIIDLKYCPEKFVSILICF